MHALTSEPGFSRLSLALALSVGVAGALHASLQHVAPPVPPLPRPTAARVQLSVVQRPVSNPTPMTVAPEPVAPPTRLASSHPALEKRRRSAASSPQTLSVAQGSPPPLLIGVTLSSTTANGRGPRVVVGNTTMGAPGEQAPMQQTAASEPASKLGIHAAPNANLQNKAAREPEVAARLISGPTPRYSTQAKREGIEGVVVLAVTIDTSGRVVAASVLRGLGYGLDEIALSAARQTRWDPAMRGGQPVLTQRRFNIRFTIQG